MNTLLDRPCGVDGCSTPVSIERISHDEWTVTHGENREARQTFSSRSLFVDMGYAGWVSTVHAYERFTGTN